MYSVASIVLFKGSEEERRFAVKSYSLGANDPLYLQATPWAMVAR